MKTQILAKFAHENMPTNNMNATIAVNSESVVTENSKSIFHAFANNILPDSNAGWPLLILRSSSI